MVLFLGILFSDGITFFEKTGDNLFHVFVNGQEVGIVSDTKIAEDLLIAARRNIAAAETELVFMDAELSFVGEEVLWGSIDKEETVLAGMEAVLKSSVKQTMQRSYTMKVNEYMVSLSSAEEVNALLQAAIDKYATEEKFVVELQQDKNRSFHVLTAEVIDAREREQEEEENNSLFTAGGIQTIFEGMEPDMEVEGEKSFEDYELGLLHMDFAEEVEIVEAYLPQDQLTPLVEAIEQVTKDQEKNDVYEVVSGDTLSEISIKVNIPIDRIIEMNDNLENENSMIRIGEELIITVPEPELSVERVEENYYEEIYDADIIYIDNDNWYTTDQVVLQQPSAGFRKVVAVVSYYNDAEVAREILKEEIVLDAVPKIVERGTKIPPTYIKPISGGRESSGFGRRNSPTKGASSNHKGQDWAVPTGTTVVASNGGVVAKAGWGSGYGYVVYINHEGGRQTRYAHLSKVLVTVGQTVKQGEKIALSGNTGISTGPHVHFEILINGVQVDPKKYIDK
ncbi:M23 family metallopeptidase [Lachnospiraceae bacterium OttesenSCG-928-D06]|nr:M23 family metallopeptidase [Lachnospiraceae bacterium OttesenSCG-928-D06]